MASRPGVIGIDDPKWILVAAAYIAAIALMALDPWFGDDMFSYSQGIFVVLLAFIVVAGVAWESCLLGRPKGINLVLQIVLIAPATLFIGRIIGTPSSLRDPGPIMRVWETLTWAQRAMDLIPPWVMDIFRSPYALLLILIVSLAFTQRSANRRVGLLIVAFLIPLINSFAHPPSPSTSFMLGMVCLWVGVWLQSYPYLNIAAEQQVLNRLHAVRDEQELTCSLRLAKQALEDGFVSEEATLAIVQRTFGDTHQLTPDEVRQVGRALSQRLVREHRVLELHGDERGFFLVPNPGLYNMESLLDEVAGILRKTILTVIGLLWLLSPVDLLPDFVPIVGVLDDVLIGLIGAGQWVNKLPGRHRLKRP